MDKHKFIIVTSLKTYQHYHDNKHNSWFKWYAECLQSYDFMSLSCTQKWLFIGLICLGIKQKNQIKYDVKYLQNVLKIRSIDKNLKALEYRQMIDYVYKDSTQIREDKKREEEEREKIQKEVKASFYRKEE